MGKRRGDKLSTVSENTSFQVSINQELVWRLDFNHKRDWGVQGTQEHAEVMVVHAASLCYTSGYNRTI